MTAAEFISRLGPNAKATKTTSGWQCRCPAHDDSKASLSVSDTSDRVLVHCHAGCKPEAVCAEAGVKLADLFNGAKLERNGTFRKIVATYGYRDESGKLLFQTVRYDPKDFRQRAPDTTAPDGWRWKIEGVRRVLYRLPEIVRDVKHGLPIIVCEGEKDADALAQLGLSATCNVGGASKPGDKKWQPQYAETLRGACAYIIADKDPTGRVHAQAVAASLHGVASFVAVLELPDLAGRTVKDAHDFISAGGTAAELMQLFDTAPKWTPPAVSTKASCAEPQPIKPGTSAADYLANETAPVTNIADRLAAVRFNLHTPPPQEAAVFQTTNGTTIATRGNIGAITAQAKAGKTAFIAAVIAAAIAPRPEDCDLLGIRAVNPEGLPVLLLDTEHSPHHHHALCDRILRRAMLTESEQLHAYRLAGFSVPDLIAALEHLLAERRWLAAILDGAGDFVTDVNDPAECNQFVAQLHGLAIQHDMHILNVLHLNPASDFKSRGHLGSQLERKAETNLRIEKVDGISVVFADKNRGADIPKKSGPRFAWSSDKQMHVSVATIANGKAEAKTQELKEQIDEAFRLAAKSALHWKDLVAASLQVPGIGSERTAGRIIADLKLQQLIRRNLIGQWEKTP